MNDVVVSSVTELHDAELDLIAAAGFDLNLSHLVNINVAIPTQIGLNIAILTSNISQWINQGLSVRQ